jgi:hypothetical protein
VQSLHLRYKNKMSGWRDEIKKETQRAREAGRSGSSGRLRIAARRIAGIALAEFYGGGGDFPRMLREAMNDTAVPDAVRAAAGRLQSRALPDFTSVSIDPLGDAFIIVAFVDRSLSQI